MRRGLLPLVFGLGLALRAIPFPAVFSERGLLPGVLADEFYHLRRIWYSVVHFPDVLSFDPYVNFPDGGHIHWPPGFDWAVAALARLLVGPEDPGAVEVVAAWVPAVLGALTAAGAAWVGRAAFGGIGGATAGLALAVLPASWAFSQIGMVDHHVAVALASVLLLGAAMAWLRRAPAPTGRGPGARGESRRSDPGLAVALGLALGAPFLVWPGFLIHAAVTQAALVAATLAAADRAEAVGRAWSLAGAHAVAAAVVLPFCLGPPFEQYGAWSPLVLSRFQPAWLGGGAAALAGAALLWSRSGAGALRRRRIAAAAAVGGAGVVAALLLAPGLREALLYASGWFAKAEAFQARVAELSPLTLSKAGTRLSWAVVAFPLAWAGVAASALRERAPDRALLLGWAAVFGALALAQNRFTNSFSVVYVLVWGGALAAAAPVVWRRLAGRPGLAAAAALAAGVALAAALVPVARFYGAQLERSRAALDGPAAALVAMRPAKRVQLGAARWLARSSPPTRGFLDPGVRPEYGILSSWGAGHLLRYRAERPLVQDNFGVYGGRENFERAWVYYAATDEAEARALLERLRVRYVVADRGGAGTDPRVYPPRSMAYRLAGLFGSAGSATDPETGRRVEVPALAHHRLVYHARSGPGASLRAAPPQVAIAVYEVVPGARVEGRAAPGARVEARLRVTTQAGPRYLPRAREPLIYRARTRADAAGRYRLTLPYPTDAVFSDAVRVAAPYRIRSGERAARLEVPEAAVRAGSRAEGPGLAP